jgi:hypothetical protein
MHAFSLWIYKQGQYDMTVRKYRGAQAPGAPMVHTSMHYDVQLPEIQWAIITVS